MGAPRSAFGLAAALGLLSGCVSGLEDNTPFLQARGVDTGVDGVDSPDAGVVTGPVCPDVVSEILSNPQGCAALGCHAAEANQAGLDLESPDLVGRLTNMPASPTCSGLLLIDPAFPEMSLLTTKLVAPAPCGSPMPLGALLPDEDVACLQSWLQAEIGGPADAGVDPADAGETPDAGEDGGVQAPDAGEVDPIEVEAEFANLEAPVIPRPGPDAQGGQYVVVPLGPGRNDDPEALGVGRILVPFSTPAPATFHVFARARCPDIESNSYWVRVDDGPWFRWNDINLENEGVWRWEAVHDSDNASQRVEFAVGAGNHVLELRMREAGTQIDALLLTRDPSLDPNAR